MLKNMSDKKKSKHNNIIWIVLGSIVIIGLLAGIIYFAIQLSKKDKYYCHENNKCTNVNNNTQAYDSLDKCNDYCSSGKNKAPNVAFSSSGSQGDEWPLQSTYKYLYYNSDKPPTNPADTQLSKPSSAIGPSLTKTNPTISFAKPQQGYKSAIYRMDTGSTAYKLITPDGIDGTKNTYVDTNVPNPPTLSLKFNNEFKNNTGSWPLTYYLISLELSSTTMPTVPSSIKSTAVEVNATTGKSNPILHYTITPPGVKYTLIPWFSKTPSGGWKTSKDLSIDTSAGTITDNSSSTPSIITPTTAPSCTSWSGGGTGQGCGGGGGGSCSALCKQYGKGGDCACNSKSVCFDKKAGVCNIVSKDNCSKTPGFIPCSSS